MLSLLLMSPLQVHKVNPPLATSGSDPAIVGDVSSYAWSPEGNEAFYIADQESDDVGELFATKLSGVLPNRRVSAPLDSSGQLQQDVIAEGGAPCTFEPGGTHLLYEVSSVTPFTSSTSTFALERGDGSTAGLYGNGSFPRIGSGRVAYLHVVTSGLGEIASTRLDGLGTPVKLSPGGFGSLGAVLLRLNSAGTRVVFTFTVVGQRPGVYSAPIDGSAAAIALHGTANSGRQTRSLELTPDGTRAVYVADDVTNDVDELWSVPIDGSSPPTRLNQAIAGALDVSADFVISPDGARVVFRADADVNELFELYSVPTSGGAVVKLNGPMVAGGGVPAAVNGDAPQFQFSPDANWVVYRAAQDTLGVFELYAARADGSSPAVRLNAPLPLTSEVPAYAARISADSQLVVFSADADVANRYELYAVPIDGSLAPVKLNPPMGSGGSLQISPSSGARDAFALVPGGGWVVYLADQTANNLFELFSVPTDGSQLVVQRSAPLVANGDVKSFALAPSGSNLLYLADQDTDEVFELYLSKLPLPNVPVRGGAPGRSGVPGSTVTITAP